MSLFKRSEYWHYDFWFQKRRHQGSTRLKNHEKAKMFVAKLRTDLAMGLVGLAVRQPAPLLKDFLEGDFLEHVTQNAKKPRTLKFYSEKIDRLIEYPPFTRKYVDEIDELAIQGFKDWRTKQKKKTAGVGLVSVASINGELRTLRKALIFAKRCKVILDRPFVSTLPGEQGREFILTGELENLYLETADYPLRHVAILILDLGLRPEEALSLKKADVTLELVVVQAGKSEKARRALPQTDRTRDVFKVLAEFFPDSPWVFPGRKGSHLTRGAVDNLHTKLRNAAGTLFPKEFVLYSCRHTFATRLAESTGGNLFILKEALGHADIRMCQKYVHPEAETLRLAMRRKEVFDKILRGETVEVPTISTTAEKEDA